MPIYTTLNQFVTEHIIIFAILMPLFAAFAAASWAYQKGLKAQKRQEYNLLVEPFIHQIKRYLITLADNELPEINLSGEERLAITLRVPPRINRRLQARFQALDKLYQQLQLRYQPESSADVPAKKMSFQDKRRLKFRLKSLLSLLKLR